MLNKKQKAQYQSDDFDKSIRADFYKRLLRIAICIIPLWLLADERPPLSYVALIFFVYGMYQLIIIVRLSQSIIDSFFPPVTLVETKSKPFDKFMYHFSGAFFFISLVFLLFQFRTFENTIDGTSLFWKAGFSGVLLAILITMILKKTNPSVYFESKRRYTVHFSLFMGCFLGVASGANFINHTYAETKIKTQEFILKQKSIGGDDNDSHWLFIETKPGSEERFEVKESFFATVEEGQTILLDTKKGKLGYEVIVAFRRKDTTGN